MNKESKYYITIEKSNDSSFFKVELKDHYGSYNSVYEKTIDEAISYAKNWCKETDNRHEADQIHARAIAQCIQIDKKAGITSGNRDSLD